MVWQWGGIKGGREMGGEGDKDGALDFLKLVCIFQFISYFC